MYTCDFCGADVLRPENLVALNHRNEEGKRFYEYCDILACSKCADEHEESMYVVDETVIEAYETSERISRNV